MPLFEKVVFFCNFKLLFLEKFLILPICFHSFLLSFCTNFGTFFLHYGKLHKNESFFLFLLFFTINHHKNGLFSQIFDDSACHYGIALINHGGLPLGQRVKTVLGGQHPFAFLTSNKNGHFLCQIPYFYRQVVALFQFFH